ncbi:Uu.00g124310.m01.CDS01 [Anthostomella pinea]|uniref:Uu.00g124310.m01.CDS01 n=1 Tax=Anthostomella pinea TaxID=933095 RepID=A0AAI8VHK8_9PEZI|nr:Uu.00g124310.m01.CDS01 [Anthostomella pinea]
MTLLNSVYQPPLELDPAGSLCFPQFPLLPPEIRLKIWEHSLQRHLLVQVSIKAKRGLQKRLAACQPPYSVNNELGIPISGPRYLAVVKGTTAIHTWEIHHKHPVDYRILLAEEPKSASWRSTIHSAEDADRYIQYERGTQAGAGEFRDTMDCNNGTREEKKKLYADMFKAYTPGSDTSWDEFKREVEAETETDTMKAEGKLLEQKVLAAETVKTAMGFWSFPLEALGIDMGARDDDQWSGDMDTVVDMSGYWPDLGLSCLS